MSTEFSNYYWELILGGIRGSGTLTHPAVISLYSGTPPATCENGNATSNGAVKLADVSITSAHWSYPAHASIRLTDTSFTSSGSNTGTVAWARLCDANDTYVIFQTDAGIVGSGAGIILDSLDLTSASTDGRIVELGLTLPLVNGSFLIDSHGISRILRRTFKHQNITAGLHTSLLRIYSGAPPASLSDPVTGTLLYSKHYSGNAWNSPSGGSMAFDPITTETPVANGVPGYFRITDIYCNIQGSCGGTGSGKDMILSQSTLSTSTTFDIQELTISKP